MLFDGITKKAVVPAGAIGRACVAKELFTQDPDRHTYGVNEDEG